MDDGIGQNVNWDEIMKEDNQYDYSQGMSQQPVAETYESNPPSDDNIDQNDQEMMIETQYGD